MRSLSAGYVQIGHAGLDRVVEPLQAQLGLDHSLNLGPAIVGGRGARLYIGLDELIAARGAIGFTLLALVGDRDIVLAMPRRRDAQIEGGAQRHGHDSSRKIVLRRPARKRPRLAEQRLKLLGGGWRVFIARSGHWSRIAERGP